MTTPNDERGLVRIDPSNALPDIVGRAADPIQAIETMGDWFARSGMFGCTQPAQGRILALAALVERKSPFEISSTYHLIDGKLSMRSRAQLAAFRARGGKVLWTVTTDAKCEAEWSFEGAKTTVGFTMEEAKRQGLVRPGSAWEKDPAAMLRARATTRAITMLCPEILVAGGHADDDMGAGEPIPAEVEPVNPLTPAPAPAKPASPRKQAAKASPAKPAPSTTTEPEKTAEAEKPAAAEPTETPAPAQQTEPAAEPTPEPEAKPAEPAPAEVEVLATVEQIQAVEAAAEGCEEAALAWLAEKGWIQNGNMATLTADKAKRILDAPERFVRASKNAAAKK